MRVIKIIPKVPCKYCDCKPLLGWIEWAKHIIANHKDKHSSYELAQKIITKVEKLNRKLENKKLRKKRQEPEEKARYAEKIKREVSGNGREVETLCLKGQHIVERVLPVEYIQSQEAHRIQGILAVICDQHRNRKIKTPKLLTNAYKSLTI
jgi:hypothetical protein